MTGYSRSPEEDRDYGIREATNEPSGPTGEWQHAWEAIEDGEDPIEVYEQVFGVPPDATAKADLLDVVRAINLTNSVRERLEI